MTHIMTLADDHEGTQEWTCPECGRVLLIEWEPWKRTVVVPGDELAMHSGGTGGLVIGGITAVQDE